jgi:hypothetical protein
MEEQTKNILNRVDELTALLTRSEHFAGLVGGHLLDDDSTVDPEVMASFTWQIEVNLRAARGLVGEIWNLTRGPEEN